MVESIFNDVVILISILCEFIILRGVCVWLVVPKSLILINRLPAQGGPLRHSGRRLSWTTLCIVFSGSQLRQILVYCLAVSLPLAHLLFLGYSFGAFNLGTWSVQDGPTVLNIRLGVLQKRALLLNLVGILLNYRPVVLYWFRSFAFWRRRNLPRWPRRLPILIFFLLMGWPGRCIIRLIPHHILFGARSFSPHSGFGAFANSLGTLPWFCGRSSLIGDRIVALTRHVLPLARSTLGLHPLFILFSLFFFHGIFSLSQIYVKKICQNNYKSNFILTI